VLRLSVVAAAICVLAAGCGHSGRRVGGHGLTLAVPHGWHTWVPLVPPGGGAITDPGTRIVAVSAPFSVVGHTCEPFDYGFRSGAVGIVLVEWKKTSDIGPLPPRPRRFTSKTLPVRRHELECWDGPGGGIQFADHGRDFGAYILLGPAAPPKLAEQARKVLDTLRVRSS
jgi:hypothetical protein